MPPLLAWFCFKFEIRMLIANGSSEPVVSNKEVDTISWSFSVS